MKPAPQELYCEDCHQPASENDFSYVDRKVRHTRCREATPPLCCDYCEFPMGAHEIVREPDGAIPGRLKCSLCVEDDLAARQLEHTL